MKSGGDDSDSLGAAERLVGRAIAEYLNDDGHWHAGQPAPGWPAWPAAPVARWRLRCGALDHAWNLASHLYERRCWPDALPAGWRVDESSPHHRLVDRVATAAALHALRACRRHFASMHLAGRRQRASGEKARLIGEALSAGMSLPDAFRVADVSRAQGYRLLRTKHPPKG